MSIAQPYGIVTFDEQVTLFELSTIGGINLPAAAIDSELELAASIKVNAMADLQPGGTRFAQEALIEELKVALEAADAALDAKIDQEIADRSAAVSSEETARIAGDAALQANIDAEAAARAAQDTALSNSISDEALARSNADTTLQNNINAEATSRANADAAIQSDVDANEAAALADRTAIRSEFAAADSALESDLRGGFAGSMDDLDVAIIAEEDRAVAAEASLSSDIAAVQADVDQNEADSDSAHSAATTDRAAIRAEFAAADAAQTTALETKMANDIATAVTNLIDGAPAALDTLNELAASIADDADFAGTMLADLTAAATDRTAIRSEFAAADSALELAIRQGSNAGSFAGSMQDLDDALIAEEDRAVAAENALDVKIDQEIADRIAAVTAENTAMLAAVAAENAAMLAAVAGVQADVDQNESDSDAAEAALQANIDAEEAARIAADGVLQGNIDAEAGSRAAGDAALQGELDASQLSIGLNNDGSFNGHAGSNYMDAATSMRGADLALDSALKSEENSRVAAVSAEESARISGDAAVTTAFQAADAAMDTELKGLISDEESARIAAVSAEASARAAADTAEAAARLAADNTLQANIDAEAVTARAAESANATAIADEETRALAAEAAEQAARIAGDASTLVSAKAYTDAEVAALVDAAPELLDTLNELAAAIGDDENFATTVANNLATESARAQAAEAAIQADVDGNEADADASFAAATTDRAAVRTEFAAADATLQGNIDAEEASRIGADDALMVIADERIAGKVRHEVINVAGGEQMTKQYVVLDAAVGGLEVMMREDDQHMTFVTLKMGSAPVKVKFSAVSGITFGDGAAFVMVYEGQNVSILVDGSDAYLF
jgi:hypothetical protein